VSDEFQRSASAALDEARPAIDRLDAARDPEDVAADLIDAWEASQRVLRTLAGNQALGGQALIRTLRQRQLLTLDQAHALVEFGAVYERAQSVDYRPSDADIATARAGFQQLEALVRQPPVPPREAPKVQTGPLPPQREELILPPPDPIPQGRTQRSTVVAVVLGIVVWLGLIGGGAWYYLVFRNADRDLQRGIAAYAAGDRATARTAFAAVAREHPDVAAPHTYLGRMAREEGDVATAARELEAAVRLEPNNAVALREMGAHLLASGIGMSNAGNINGAKQNFELASRFYVRSLRSNSSDRNAMGFLGCTLMRLGRREEAMRFLDRAGQGSWSVCAALPAPAPAPALPNR
jgi:tetratricopeptide (TPR) repeat protein